MRIAVDSNFTSDLRLLASAPLRGAPSPTQIGTAGYFDEPRLSARVLTWLDEPRVELDQRQVQRGFGEILRHSTIPGTTQNILRMLARHEGPPLSDRELFSALVDIAESNAPQMRGLRNLAEQALHKFDVQDPVVCLEAIARNVRTLRVDYRELETRILSGTTSQEFQSAVVDMLGTFRDHEHAGLYSVTRGFSQGARLTAQTYRELIDGPALSAQTAGKELAMIAVSNAPLIPDGARAHFLRLPEMALRETNALATAVMDSAIAQLAGRDRTFSAEAIQCATAALGGSEPSHERLRAIMLLGRIARSQPELRQTLEKVTEAAEGYSAVERYFAALALSRDSPFHVAPSTLRALAAGLPEISTGRIGDFTYPPHNDGMSYFRSTEEDFRAQVKQGALTVFSRRDTINQDPGFEREILYRMVDALFDGPPASGTREAIRQRIGP